MLLQIIRFTLPAGQSIAKSDFAVLRSTIAKHGALHQYFGYSIPTQTAPLPKERHEITWAINWPREEISSTAAKSLAKGLTELSPKSAASSLLLPVEEQQWGNYEIAFKSPLCEFAIMQFAEKAPVTDGAFIKSTHKTYTDCYRGDGFAGGDWGWGSTTNSSSGLPLSEEQPPVLPPSERRLAVYILGWESENLHLDFSKTEIFAEEMNNLIPFVDKIPGTGAWYVPFQKHE